MDQQQQAAGYQDPLTGTVAPQDAPGARLEPMGDTWASGVGPVRVGPRTSRFRWAIALGVVLCVALVTVGGAFVLSGAGAAAKSLTAGDAPKNTIAFVDVRTDLPGDQHQNLADFLSHFPGFADRSQFDGAFDDVLNRITSAISPDLTYTSAFQSWTTGELSVAVTSLGGAAMPGADLTAPVATEVPDILTIPTFGTTPPSGVVIVALKDRAVGEKWVGSEIARTGVAFSTQSYAGTTLFVAKTATDGATAAYAFTDKVFVAGDVAAVKAALDAPATGSLADSAGYQAAIRSLSGDSIATFYMNPQALVQSAMTGFAGLGEMSGASMVPAAGMNLSAASVPAWLVGSVRADSDHMTIQISMPKPAGTPSPSNSVSVVASDLPGSTVAVFEIHSVGQLVDAELKTISGSALASDAPDAMKQVQQALSVIGGVDWIGDADAVLIKDGASYGGGLVVKTADSATATSKAALITNLAAVSALGGSGITQTDEASKGTTITNVHVPGSDGSADLDIAVATKGDLIVAGYGDAFVKAVLDTTSASSLASNSTYQSVMKAVGASNSEYGYFDISAVADQIGRALFAADPGSYNVNYKPYVDHVGGAAFAEIDGSTVTMRLVLTAK